MVTLGLATLTLRAVFTIPPASSLACTVTVCGPVLIGKLLLTVFPLAWYSRSPSTEIRIERSSAAGQLFRLLAWRRLAATVRKKLLGRQSAKNPMELCKTIQRKRPSLSIGQ